ncbi:MarR family transcriptional regulator [Alcaligenes endophyticus]|uniref:MarR family transcriptional regulator n=1 Tax=Alcaligenes endophyticus TaxID=1929088 RepID=A0ABT8EHD0_9BURK|nr:helix-turn-helix domain-containing protein [Alcaligenes endophyticus]MCX5589647.1 helix-turn-helix domain-containing protein [Alcaligenes endophyticus]MDN4120689.1 MarR family transcriptional regulator [Alcaligenes endophyticus]
MMNPVMLPVHAAPLIGRPSSAPKTLPARDMFSEHVLNDLNHMLTRQYTVYAEAMKAAIAAEVGIPLNDYKALEYIMEFDALPTGQLAQLLDLSASGVSALIKRLTEAGYIKKGRHPLDKRITALYPVESTCAPLMRRKEQALELNLREVARHNPNQLMAVYDFLLNNANNMRYSTNRWLDLNSLVSRY